MTVHDQRPDLPARSAGDDAEDDAAVIRRSRDDPEHFAVLFRRHAPGLQHYVRRRLGVSAADDVVAETFLAAFRQRDRYDFARENARPWLYGIATNLIGRYHRSEIQQYRVLARTGLDPVTEPFTDRVDAAVSAAGERRQLAAALARLPAAHPADRGVGRPQLCRGRRGARRSGRDRAVPDPGHPAGSADQRRSLARPRGGGS